MSKMVEYVILEDVDGVGVVTGFKEGTPQDIIDEYFSYEETVRKAKEEGFYL